MLADTHGRDIWLDKLIFIDIEIIVHITRFLARGMNPVQFLNDKKNEKSLVEEMKNKYGTDRGT